MEGLNTERLLHSERVDGAFRGEPKNDLSQAVGQRDSGLKGRSAMEDCEEGY